MINRDDKLKKLASDFLAGFSPETLSQVDSLFEQLKTDTATKLEVNFGFAMPPEMRRKILSDIGIDEVTAPRIADRHLPYLKILQQLVSKAGDNPASITKEQVAELVIREGHKLKLFDYEIQQLLNFMPTWFESISKKCLIEISPAGLCEVSSSRDNETKIAKGASISFEGIIGQSQSMQSIFACLKKVSASHLSILIEGESGTGKELVAHAIHSLSDRSAYNFIPVNCGALPDSIIESELFGYEKGAFTGADIQKKGYFEISNDGTIFLDEITETSLNTQVKLLRVLQEKQFYRVGGTRPVSANCRVIAATNRDISEMAGTGAFRHDLFYRINEMTISLPPLRERKEDLPLLVEHFIRSFSRQNKRNAPSISKAAMQSLQSYSWPGNIRELENALKRAIVLSDDEIKPEHFPETIASKNFMGAAGKEAKQGTLEFMLAQAEREILLQQLKKNSFNVSKTAQELDISRRTLQRKMLQLNITRP